MGNAFTDRDDPTISQDVNEQDIVVNILQQEFPNDPVLSTGMLSMVSTPTPKPVTDIAKRNTTTGLLEIDADVSASFAEYSLVKLVPSVDDDELDDILDDEFEQFIEDEDGGFPIPVTTGLFLINAETNLVPLDYHDSYIRRGPEMIPELLANGISDEEIPRQCFCVWFIDRNIARPIPNYKTLEVMLVERGLTYTDIAEADEEDNILYDLKLEGRFKQASVIDENGNPVGSISAYDEFMNRAMIDRTKDWNVFIRFQSGYTLGQTLSGKQFTRDPGDYRKPNSLKYLTPPTVQEIQDIRNQDFDFPVFWPQLPDNIEISPRLYRYYKEQTPYINVPIILADPDDLYFDTCLIGPSDEEVFRSQFEGQLLLLQWPTNNYIRAVVENETELTRFDDLYFDLRFMIHGHLKQVLSLKTLKYIARINGIDTSRYDAGLEEYPANPNTSELDYQLQIDALDEQQYEALTAQAGIVQILAEGGAITVLGETRVDTGQRRIWDDFGQIASVNRLDEGEYKQYKDYESNNLNMFSNPALEPYEPAGSLVYYPQDRYRMLAEESIAQDAFDTAVKLLRELFPPLAAKVSEFNSRMSGITPQLANKMLELFGAGSNLHQIMYISDERADGTAAASRTWKLQYRKNNGSVRDKEIDLSFWAICEKRGWIFGGLSKYQENNFWYADGNPWHLTTQYYSYGLGSVGYTAYQKYGGDDVSWKFFDAEMLLGMQIAAGNYADSEPNRKGTLGSIDQRYGRPENGDGRIRGYLRRGECMAAGVAMFIVENIIDPAKYKRPNEMPANVITGDDDAPLYTRCVEAEQLLRDTAQAVSELEEYIKDIDQRILDATTPEEILDIYNYIVESRDLLDDFDESVFTYLEDLESYMDEWELKLGRRIVDAVQKMRGSIYNRKNKWFIKWPSANRTAANRYRDTGFDDYVPEGV